MYCIQQYSMMTFNSIDRVYSYTAQQNNSVKNHFVAVLEIQQAHFSHCKMKKIKIPSTVGKNVKK